MTDRLMAVLAILGLLTFLIVVPLFVPEPDLILLTVGCAVLAAIDFWRELFRNGVGK